jgi:hypothetical protein
MTRADWRRAISYGLVWGVAVTALESLELPLGNLRPDELVQFTLQLLPHLCVAGIVLVIVTIRTSQRGADGWLVLWALVLFPVLTCAINAALKRVFLHDELWATAGGDSYLHTFWTSLCYGSIFLVAYRLNVRAESTRQWLARTEIARQHSENSLAETRFEALRGHVDPAFLLRVVTALRARYALDPVAADQLLDRLVAFLRAAMPGIRGGGSTLFAEATLALHYAQVLHELDPASPLLRVDAHDGWPDLPFPPLLMLPVVDQLTAATGASGIDLSLSQHGNCCVLTLRVTPLSGPAWLSTDLAFRLQVGLRAMFQDDWSLRLADQPGQPVLTLTLPAPASVTAAPSMAFKEVTYG